MAVVAVNAARDMRRVFADRSDAIVARAASAQHLRVIDGVCWRPNIGVVAVFADIRGLHVREILALCLDAVMAACTVAGDIDVIEIRGQPANCRMAVVTVAAAGNMSWVFAGRDYAIVAGAANPQNLCVVDCGRRLKRYRVVAIFADIAGRYMRWAFAGRGSAIMTTDAVSENIGVVESCREPASRTVTIFALIPG